MSETIQNEEEWVAFCKRRYPGSPNWKPNKFPPAYPCLAKMGTVGGGLAGESTSFKARYATGLPHAPHTKWKKILIA